MSMLLRFFNTNPSLNRAMCGYTRILSIKPIYS